MSKRKVLVIDDEEDFGLLLKIFLEKKKCNVVVTKTIAEGLKVLAEFEPDFIFLDNNLPDGSGWEKAAFIRQRYPASRLNLISGYKMHTTPALAHRVFEKPLSLYELESIVNSEDFAGSNR